MTAADKTAVRTIGRPTADYP